MSVESSNRALRSNAITARARERQPRATALDRMRRHPRDAKDRAPVDPPFSRKLSAPPRDSRGRNSVIVQPAARRRNVRAQPGRTQAREPFVPARRALGRRRHENRSWRGIHHCGVSRCNHRLSNAPVFFQAIGNETASRTNWSVTRES